MESASRLALLLTQPFAHAKESIDQLIDELSLSISNNTPFTAIVLKTDTEEEFPLSEANAIFLSVREFLKTFHINCIFAEKRVQYMVYFLFGSSPGAAVRKSIEEFFCSLYSRCTRFCIAAGDTVTGISKAYQSYTSAVISLQSSFFFPHRYLSHLSPFYQAPVSENSSSAFCQSENEFLTLLSLKNKEKSKAFP